MKDYYSFPKNFVWGSANASYQVEGAAKEDGRGPSIWDTHCRKPGRILMDHHADVAADMYHRYKEDIRLMREIGLKAYRFSISWSRVLPTGRGKVNRKGLAYYDRFVDELLKNGITPWVTLFHWDLPQALEDDFGGWRSRETTKHFADYTALMVDRLSDRVRNWFTVNEFSVFIDMGYQGCYRAPEGGLSAEQLPPLRYNAVLAHGMAVQVIRAHAKTKPNVGVATDAVSCVPLMETPDHVAATKKAWREINAAYLTVLLEGRYPDSYLEACQGQLPPMPEHELKTIAAPLDFVGINLYTGLQIAADPESSRGYKTFPFAEKHPKMNTSWITICPQIAYWAPRMLGEIWKVKSMYFTEHGCAATDKPGKDGTVNDSDRMFFIREHLIHAHRAVSEGWPLKGIFQWSFLDNFEWDFGYTDRFGLVYVNYQTLERTPKLSAQYYREVIRRNAVV